MGRRRKKESSRKRSLLFEESPVKNGQHLQSPIQCVNNPVTATSVPVDSDNEVTWVSPQFDGISISHRKHRQARKHLMLRSNNGRHSGAMAQKENSHQNRSRAGCQNGLRRRKFPALHFVRDTSRSASTSQQQRCGGLSRGDTEQQEENCDYPETEAARRRHSSFRKFAKSRECPPLMHVSSDYCNVNSSRGALDSGVPSSLDRQKMSEGASSLNTVCSVTASATSVQEGMKRSKRKSNTSDILLSPLEASGTHESSPKVFPGQLPVIAFFAPSPSVSVLPLHCSGNACSQNSSKTEGEDVGLDLSIPAIDLNMCVAGGACLPTIAGQVNARGEARLSQGFHSTTARSSLRRSLRLQEKYTEAMKYLQLRTPTRQTNVRDNCDVRVLVQDTPESEYGMSLRQRQQRKMNL